MGVLKIINTGVRRMRLSPAAELCRQRFKATHSIELPEVGLSIPIQAGDIVIDCGANVGDMTSRFARSGAQVYALEPNLVCYNIMLQRFRVVPNVKCLHKGIMDVDTVLELSTPIPHENFDELDVTVSASFNQHAHKTSAYSLNLAMVHCLDADNFIRSFNQKIRLVKIDIEGSEIAVLNRLIDSGAIGLIDHLVVETHERQMPHLKDATDSLRSKINDCQLTKKISLDWY